MLGLGYIKVKTDKILELAEETNKELLQMQIEKMKSIGVNSMSNTPNTINWKGTPIPEAWYAVLTQFTAKYNLNIEIASLEHTAMYLFELKAGDAPYTTFAITKNVAKHEDSAVILWKQLENAVKSMNLQPTQTMTYTYTTTTPTNISISELQKAGVKIPASLWPTKSSSKLNSLYEMYGMVEPKIRYCAKHRPTAAQVMAKIEEAEKQAEITKTIKAASPALKGSFLKSAEKYLMADDPFYKTLKKFTGGLAGNYYTDYTTGATYKTKADYEAASTNTPDAQVHPYQPHEYVPIYPKATAVQCKICQENGWGCCCAACVKAGEAPNGYIPYTKKLTKIQLKKLKKAALKAQEAELEAKMKEMESLLDKIDESSIKLGLSIDEDPEEIW